MLAIAVGGQAADGGVGFLRRHAETTRRVAGALIGVTALAIALGADQRFTTAVPGYTEALQERVERNSTAQRELASCGARATSPRWPRTSAASRRSSEGSSSGSTASRSRSASCAAGSS